jgi:hypothetical protein
MATDDEYLRWVRRVGGLLAPDGRDVAALDRAEAAYSDPSCPARDCDHCGRSYAGPAVYCSLGCALADAD